MGEFPMVAIMGSAAFSLPATLIAVLAASILGSLLFKWQRVPPGHLIAFLVAWCGATTMVCLVGEDGFSLLPMTVPFVIALFILWLADSQFQRKGEPQKDDRMCPGCETPRDTPRVKDSNYGSSNGKNKVPSSAAKPAVLKAADLKFCPACKLRIPTSADSCPECGIICARDRASKQPSKNPKKHSNKRTSNTAELNNEVPEDLQTQKTTQPIWLLVLATPIIVLAVLWYQTPKTYEECIQQSLKGVTEQSVANQLRGVCQIKFPESVARARNLERSALKNLKFALGRFKDSYFCTELYNGNDFAIKNLQIEIVMDGKRRRFAALPAAGNTYYAHSTHTIKIYVGSFADGDKKWSWNAIAVEVDAEN